MKRLVATTLSLGLLCATTSYAADVQAEAAATNSAVVEAQTQDVKNNLAGQAFLQANKSKPGVITLADGLQYKVIKAGQGALPTDSDVVTVNYAGHLIDGTEFDSSYKRGQPASFPVNGVIPGWTEALKLMKVGSIWEIYIPASLAYGENGAPPLIGANETLIFKVELLGINQPA